MTAFVGWALVGSLPFKVHCSGHRVLDDLRRRGGSIISPTQKLHGSARCSRMCVHGFVVWGAFYVEGLSNPTGSCVKHTQSPQHNEGSCY